MKKVLNVTEDYHDMRIDRWVKKKIFNVFKFEFGKNFFKSKLLFEI